MKRSTVLRYLITLIFVGYVATANSANPGDRFASFLGFRLLNGTLYDVEKELGQSTLVQTGDAGEYEASVCYRTKAGLVYFLSGELGGTDHDLMAFKITGADATKQCADYPADRAVPKLVIAGLTLGMTKAEFERAISNKIEWHGNTGNSYFLSKDPMDEAEIEKLKQSSPLYANAGKDQFYFDVQVSVAGTFSANHLVQVEVWKTETN